MKSSGSISDILETPELADRTMVGSGRDRAMEAYSIEDFTLLGVSLVVTALRTYYRATTVGIKQFWADDYFVVISSVSPTFLLIS